MKKLEFEKKPEIFIGVTGKISSGKSTVCRYLSEQYFFNEFSFATKLKDIAALAFNLDRDRLDDQDYKKEMHPVLGKTIRELLILLGTEMFRDTIDKDFWVYSLHEDLNDFMKEVERPYRICISDLRFDNEAEYIISNGGFILEVVSPKSIEVDHKSEQGIDAKFGRLVITNDGTITDLENKVDRALSIITSQ